jgi:site-specific DNA recombinase
MTLAAEIAALQTAYGCPSSTARFIRGVRPPSRGRGASPHWSCASGSRTSCRSSAFGGLPRAAAGAVLDRLTAEIELAPRRPMPSPQDRVGTDDRASQAGRPRPGTVLQRRVARPDRCASISHGRRVRMERTERFGFAERQSRMRVTGAAVERDQGSSSACRRGLRSHEPQRSKPPTTAPQTRVAIYCRQSVASDLEFGSIQAQREAVAAYVLSQRGEGWVALATRYEDHGFSGGTVERPAFQQLVADVAAGKVDIVAAYKIDRVSRSLADFTKFMSLLEKHKVGFVSTTQAFDTRTSMGRLTLNILASFSQFEREVISERITDKMQATRRRGMWTGGRPILGYRVVDKKLLIDPDEASQVRAIFRLYVESASIRDVVAELDRRGWTSKTYTGKKGQQIVGYPFTKGSLHGLLTNVVYRGQTRTKGGVVPGVHEPIIDTATFDAVAAALRDRRRPYRQQVGKWSALLVGILRCARCGAAMTHAANIRGDRVHRYYCCTTSQKQGAAACRGSRAPAGELEDVVVGRIKAIGTDASVLTATLAAAQQARRARQPELVAEARRLANERTDLTGQRANLLDALQHGGVAANAIAGRLAEVDEQLGRLQHRHDEITGQLAAIENAPVDEAACRTALAEFTSAWDELVPRERARVLGLLIDEVRYDGPAGEVTISFRDNGIRALGREATTRRPA